MFLSIKINYCFFYSLFLFVFIHKEVKLGTRLLQIVFLRMLLLLISNTFLLVKNTVDHDIIVCVRDQYKKYLNHVYIRNNEEYLFTGLPISRVYLQYKSGILF